MQTHLDGALGRCKRMGNEEGKSGTCAYRSGKKRHSRSTSRPSRDSLGPYRRAPDIYQTAPSRYRNAHIRDLPSCLRQTFPRATDPPLSLKYGPKQIPTAKHRDEMDKVDGPILTLHGEKQACLNWIAQNWLGALCFRYAVLGSLGVRLRIGAYGKDLAAYLRRMPPYEQEEIRPSGMRF